MKRLCRHCRDKAVSRPRGLCWHCYYTPGIRDLYPSIVRRGSGNASSGYRLSAEPTDAMPQTEAKLRVLEERAERGESLFHPRDARPNLL